MSTKKFDLKLATDIAFILGTGTTIYYILKLLFAAGDPSRPLSAEQKKRVQAAASRLDPGSQLELDEYETGLLANVVHPDEIASGFDSVGGLDNIVDDLRESIIFPLTHMEALGDTPLLAAPKGVLLYGPPGCGKTMLAKSLARESGANFINIQMSTLMDKWFGESNKLVAGLFSLAHKLRPCIIFIDEIDSFLRERSSTDHEASAAMKAEFMTWWDGLATASNAGVLVLGATNRPNDIDQAILRRMPKRFEVKKPGAAERRRILQILLKDTRVEPDLDWDSIVAATNGMSGSDLKETCRDAAMQAMRELYRTHFRERKQPEAGEKPVMRPLRTSDFVADLRVD